MAEYEVAFNQIVHFVPLIVHNEYEKAMMFRVLGAFVLEDFGS